jgi:hypothetical protein
MGNPSKQPVFNGMADGNAAELDPTIIIGTGFKLPANLQKDEININK